jgi:hypothetical protein
MQSNMSAVSNTKTPANARASAVVCLLQYYCFNNFFCNNRLLRRFITKLNELTIESNYFNTRVGSGNKCVVFGNKCVIKIITISCC